MIQSQGAKGSFHSCELENNSSELARSPSGETRLHSPNEGDSIQHTSPNKHRASPGQDGDRQGQVIIPPIANQGAEDGARRGRKLAGCRHNNEDGKGFVTVAGSWTLCVWMVDGRENLEGGG